MILSKSKFRDSRKRSIASEIAPPSSSVSPPERYEVAGFGVDSWTPTSFSSSGGRLLSRASCPFTAPFGTGPRDWDVLLEEAFDGVNLSVVCFALDTRLVPDAGGLEDDATAVAESVLRRLDEGFEEDSSSRSKYGTFGRRFERTGGVSRCCIGVVAVGSAAADERAWSKFPSRELEACSTGPFSVSTSS